MKIFYYMLMFTCLMVFFFRKDELGKALFLIGPLLICSIAVELMTDYQRNVLGSKDWYQYHIYQPVEYILLTMIFYENVKSVNIRKAMLASIPIFLIVLSTYYILQPRAFNSEKFIDFQVESFFLIIWAILYLVEIVNTDDVIDSILRLPVFWLSFAVLLFFAGNIFIVGLRDFLSKYDIEVRKTLMLVPQYLNFIFYIILIVGMLCTRTRKKSSSA